MGLSRLFKYGDDKTLCIKSAAGIGLWRLESINGLHCGAKGTRRALPFFPKGKTLGCNVESFIRPRDAESSRFTTRRS